MIYYVLYNAGTSNSPRGWYAPAIVTVSLGKHCWEVILVTRIAFINIIDCMAQRTKSYVLTALQAEKPAVKVMGAGFTQRPLIQAHRRPLFPFVLLRPFSVSSERMSCLVSLEDTNPVGPGTHSWDLI